VVQKISDKVKARVSATIAKYGVSYKSCPDLAKMWLELLEGVETKSSFWGELEKISHNTILPIIANCYARVFQYLSWFIAQSHHLTIVIDGSSDYHQNAPLAIELNGYYKDTMWNYPIRFCEPPNHEAKTQLKEIMDTFNIINRANEGQGDLPQLSVLSVHAIVFDNTSSNIGENRGLAGLFFPHL
jgi:hypothetical protein